MQDNWQWCDRCSGLAFLGNGVLGTCPAGGQHRHDGSGNYALGGPDVPVGQDGWRWCHRCQGLYFVGNGTHGYCPAGGPHVEDGSGNYRLRSAGAGQDGWAWCRNCQGLWFTGRTQNGRPWPGRCPAPGRDGHAQDDSGDYILDLLRSPAGPEPVGLVTVRGLPNRPPDLLIWGEKWMQILWPPYAGDHTGAFLELYEGQGGYGDRFIAELPIDATSNEQNMFGDLFYGLQHCFALRVRNAYGWSAPSAGCGTTLAPPPPSPVPGPAPLPPPTVTLFVSTQSDLDNVRIVSGVWTLTDPFGTVHPVPLPPTAGTTSLPHPGNLLVPEMWTASCAVRVLIWPRGAETPPDTSATPFLAGPNAFQWATDVNPSLRAVLSHTSAAAGVSSTNTFTIT